MAVHVIYSHLLASKPKTPSKLSIQTLTSLMTGGAEPGHGVVWPLDLGAPAGKATYRAASPTQTPGPGCLQPSDTWGCLCAPLHADQHTAAAHRLFPWARQHGDFSRWRRERDGVRPLLTEQRSRHTGPRCCCGYSHTKGAQKLPEQSCTIACSLSTIQRAGE